MIIDNRNSSFSRIGTVVFYKSGNNGFKFLPDDINQIPPKFRDNYKASLVMYHGSTNNFPSINFAEYDFSYFPEKGKFNNTLLISELDNESGILVGRDIEDTDKIGKILFPTLVDEETDNPYKYFGSLLVGGKTMYFFECLEDYYEIEIYEDILNSNIPGIDEFINYRYLEISGQSEGAIEPSTIIKLGPERDAYNNPVSFYYEKDPLKNRVERISKEYTALEYSKLCDEIFSKKIICYILSANLDTKKDESGNILCTDNLNVAFSAFQNNINPLRNKWKYDLRNDEYYNLLLDNPGFENSSDIWMDRKSGAILGNTTIDSSLCPIKNNKISRLKRTQKDYYSPYRIYSKGEDTIYKVLDTDGNSVVYTIESLCNGNIGNDPLLSPEWILKDRFLDFFTNIIYISQNPMSSGSSIDPGVQITVDSNSKVKFSISDGLGYSFSGLSIIDVSGNTIDLTEDVDYTYVLDDTNTEYNKTVIITSWDQFIDQTSLRYTNNLVFNFEPVSSVIKILAKKGDTIYHYNEWASAFSTSEFDLGIKINGQTIQSGEGSPIFTDTDMYLFIDNPETNPTVELDFSGTLIKNAIKSKYRIGNRKYTKTIAIDNDKAIDKVDFASAEYVIDMEAVKKKLSIRADKDLVACDITGLQTINLGSDFTIPFRLTKPDQYNFLVSIINFYYDSDGRIVKCENEVTLSTSPYFTQLKLNEVTTVEIEIDRQDNSYTYDLTLSGITENVMIYISAQKIIP
jgi:hypothetical protein